MKRSFFAFLFLFFLQISAYSQNFTITASANTGGTINPVGDQTVASGATPTFTIVPNTDFEIADVLVDGISQGAIPSYTFPSVTADHTISAIFSVTSHLALNKPSSALSSEDFRGPLYANDNDASNESRWASLGSNPQWWKVDLQGVFDITSIVIRNYVDGVRFYHYTIEVSLDDVTYLPYAEKTDDNVATDEGDKYIIASTARFIKATITQNSLGVGAHITDFRVYGTPSAVTYTINASAGANGTITPAGSQTVAQFADQAFDITPNGGFQIEDVIVDGTSVGAVSSYTFNNVYSDHTISASFTPIVISHTITATAGTGGTISPSGSVVVVDGADQGFTIAAASDFQIADVLVDGVSQGAISSYSFTNVTADHTISVTFTVTPHLALNKPSSAQSTEFGRDALFANDNNASNESRWASLDPNPQWWKVDLENIYSITSVIIRNYVDNSRFYHYNIEVSSDDITYSPYAAKTNDNVAVDEGDTYNVNALARYIKVTVTANSSGPGAHITDFRVYGNTILTVSNVTAFNKNYDGTTLATLNITGASLVGVTTGDDVTLVTSGATGNFADKDAGTGKVVSVSGLTLSGADAGKYTLVQPTTTANISALPIIINPTAGQTKVFSTSDPTPFTYTTSPALIGTDVLSGLLSRVTGENAGSYAFTLGTLSAGSNYSLSVAATPTFSITPKPVVITATSGQTKVYGQADPVFTYTNSPALGTGDSFSGALSRAAGVNVGTYAFTTGTLSAGSNYTLSVAATPTFSITPKPVLITATGGQTKVYGQADPVFTYTNSPALETGDNFSGALSRAVGEDVGTYVFTEGTLTAGSNYTLSVAATPTFSVTPKPVVITATAGQTKVYGQADPLFTYTNSPALETGDSFSGALGRAAGVNVGTYAFTLGTLTAGSNYSLSVAATPTFSITPKSIVVTANTGQAKIYGQADPVFTYTSSPALESGDSFSGSLSRLAGVNVGTYAFTIGTLTAGSNYNLSVAATPTFSITPKAIVITGNAGQTKIYGQSDPVFTYTNSPALETGDSFTGALSRVAGVNVGTYTYTPGTLTAGSNYTLSVASTPTFSITPKALNITGITADSKIYDGSLTATLSGTAVLTGIVGSDIVTVGGTPVAAFISSSVATGIHITVSGYTIAGAQAVNYSLLQPSGLTANITARELTIGGTFIADSKVYDGTTDATIGTNNLTLLTIAGSDDVSLIAKAVFSDITVGTAKIVRLTGSSLSGTDALNYTLSLVGAPTSLADITEFGLNVTGVTADNKVYDGTTNAVINTAGANLTGILGSDIVTLVSSSATGSFENKNAGVGKIVNTNGFTITGPDAGKYTLIQPTVTANITTVSLTIDGVTANNKVYDGTTDATLNTGSAALVGILGSDMVDLVSTSATGTFVNKNVGTGKAVSTSGFILGGTDAVNYSITQPSSTADIAAAGLTISGVIANNKVYDGTTDAVLNSSGATLVGVFGTDIVNLVSTVTSGTFADKNAGIEKNVSTSGFTINGNDADNYTLAQPLLIADILPKPLTVTAVDQTKNYGNTLTLTGTEITTVGLVAGDDLPLVTLNSPGMVSSAPVGTYTITVSQGSDSNYEFIYEDGVLSVNKSPLTATADPKTKVYGSSNPVLTISYTGFKNGETESVLDQAPVASTTALNSSNAGSYPISLAGGSDNNYELTLVHGSLEIQKASLTITAEDKSKAYKQPNPDLSIIYSGFVPGDDQSVLDILPVASTDAGVNSDAGNYDIEVSGAASVNYSFVYINGTLTITKADQVITFNGIPSGLRVTQEYQLDATATSGLSVSFEVSDPSIVSIINGLMTVISDGNFIVTARQDGNINWNPAADATQSVVTLPSFDNISSLFTPNNDGINDYWYIPKLEEYGNLQVTVYNRFGQSVYKSDSYKNDWDGTWNGNPLPSASYYYIMKSSEKGIIKGVVNIVR